MDILAAFDLTKTARSAALQALQERRPEQLLLAVADVDPKDLVEAVGVDPKATTTARDPPVDARPVKTSAAVCGRTRTHGSTGGRWRRHDHPGRRQPPSGNTGQTSDSE
jgi:hypothetical protein